MPDPRVISGNKKFQSIGAENFTTKVIVMRKVVADGHAEFDGALGDSSFTYRQVAKGWPASIVHRTAHLEIQTPGEFEKGDFILTSQHKALSDGKLLIRERDIVIDMETRDQYLVIWSCNPMNTRVMIIAGMESGTINQDLTEQG